MNTTNCPLSRTELADVVIEAQSHLVEAISSLRQYVAFTGDTYTERTIVAQLEIFAGIGSWMHRDRSLDDILRTLEENDDEE